jgi:Ni,Fe-hydrogenase I small subunit
MYAMAISDNTIVWIRTPKKSGPQESLIQSENKMFAEVIYRACLLKGTVHPKLNCAV